MTHKHQISSFQPTENCTKNQKKTKNAILPQLPVFVPAAITVTNPWHYCSVSFNYNKKVLPHPQNILDNSIGWWCYPIDWVPQPRSLKVGSLKFNFRISNHRQTNLLPSHFENPKQQKLEKKNAQTAMTLLPVFVKIDIN